MVERQASAGVRGPARLGQIAGPGSRTALGGGKAGRRIVASFASRMASPPHCSQRQSCVVLLILWPGGWCRASMLILTRDGRLLADVIRDLLEWGLRPA